jgi:hypothetical protein
MHISNLFYFQNLHRRCLAKRVGEADTLNKLNSKCKNFVEQDIEVIQLISNLSLYNELPLGTHYNNAENKLWN